MKYKLKRDLPNAKAGEIFKINEVGNLCKVSSGKCIYSAHMLKTYPGVLTWFEAVQEDGLWKPEEGEGYCYIDNDGVVDARSWTEAYITAQGRHSIGNVFKTAEEAKKSCRLAQSIQSAKRRYEGG